MSQRKREGKESDLYVDGVLVPKSKVQKETSRNCFFSLAEQYAEGNPPDNFDNGMFLKDDISANPGDTIRYLHLYTYSIRGGRVSDGQFPLVPIRSFSGVPR